MQAAVQSEVSFERKPTANILVEAKVGLITLGNAQSGIKSPCELCIEQTKLANDWRIGCECLRKVKIRTDEATTLIGSHQLSGPRIHKTVCIEE